jgi:hypothetical protein
MTTANAWLNPAVNSIFSKTMHRTLLTAFMLSAAFNGIAMAAPILDYRDAPELASSPVSSLPESVFHAWETADAEAGKIIGAWRTEPTTVPWTRVQLERYVKHKIMPTRGARGLALVHVAMHDAHDTAVTRNMDPRLVVSMAAAQVLGYLFIAEERAFDRIAFSVAAQLSQTKPDALPAEARRALELGRAIGERVVRRGETDGAQKGWNGIRLQWYGEGRYYGTGTWEPTPPYFYYPPDEPFAPTWGTWALDRPDEFRPIPPAYGSSRYIRDLQEVVQINQNLSPDQLKIAKFWVDGYGSVTPPGHWNQIAIDEVVKAKLDSATTARMFAHLNMAQADAFIAVWDTKYHYWTARPVSVAKRLLGTPLAPALLTPPFPSYVSAFSGAAGYILGVYFPDGADKFKAMAEEAALSRLLAGIHFRHDNEDGLQLGRKVGEKVLTRFPMGR